MGGPVHRLTMVNLHKAFWPGMVEVHGVGFPVHTEHWFWLDFSRMVRMPCRLDALDFLYDGEVPGDRAAGFEALKGFYAPPSPLPRDIGGMDERCVDFEQDEDLIYAAFMQCYGIDLKAEALHWHKFLALFRGLGGTKLNDVMGYRSYSEGDKGGYEQFMRDMKNAWRLEEPEIGEDAEAREKFEETFG